MKDKCALSGIIYTTKEIYRLNPIMKEGTDIMDKSLTSNYTLSAYNNNITPVTNNDKRKRKKKKKFRGILRLFIILLFLITCVFIAKTMSRIIFEIINSYDNTFSSGYNELSENNKEDFIKQLKAENYPESLINLYEKHPETKEFVQNYPKYKDNKGKINIKKDVDKGGIPLFLQWDQRWGYRKYGGDFIAVTGCGPTCLSMVQCGLSGKTKWNPYRVAKMAEDNGFYVEGSGSSWDLMNSGAGIIGLVYNQVPFERESILNWLSSGNPIICSMGPGDFTTTGHFIVLSGTDGNGNVTVNDPNSIENSSKTWDIDEIMPQVRNLWRYSL